MKQEVKAEKIMPGSSVLGKTLMNWELNDEWSNSDAWLSVIQTMSF